VTESPPPEARLLLIDDDHHAEALAAALTHFNVVVDARSSNDAAAFVFAEMAEPHVLLTGVLMAHAHGVDLADAMRDTWPSLGVVFMAGATAAPMFERVAPGDIVLRRPFTTNELLEALRSAAPWIEVAL
jgi:FixJ family two-component response regulator